jgi:hypothetical protein
VKLQVAVLVDPSVTFQLTAVMPLLNTTLARVAEPLPVVTPLNTYPVVDPGQLSLKAVGLNSVPTAVYVHTPVLVLLVWLLTQLIVGFSLSFTVIVKLHVAVLVERSVTFHVTVVMPLLNITLARVVEPLPVVTPLNAYPVVDPGQLSLKAVGLNSVPTAV